jgi:hypothetical protein
MLLKVGSAHARECNHSSLAVRFNFFIVSDAPKRFVLGNLLLLLVTDFALFITFNLNEMIVCFWERTNHFVKFQLERR